MNLLVTSYYKASSEERQNEIDYCVFMNTTFFDEVVLMIDGDVEIPKIIKPNVTVYKTNSRPTFRDAFNKASELNPDGINVVANTDIYFDREALDIIGEIDYDKTSLALSRVDVQKNSSLIHWHKRDSQDAFVFKGEMKLGSDADFNFGIPGCDNRICNIMSRTTKVYNPCLTISIFHLHNTAVRSYTKKDKVNGEYTLVDPCKYDRKKKKFYYPKPIVTQNVTGRRKDTTEVLLSILIPTMEERRDKFSKLVKHLFKQIDEGGYTGAVEIVKKCDNGEWPIGMKRNNLLFQAKGKYVVCIDDDDWVPDFYIEKIMEKIDLNADCITFKGKVWVDGKNEREYNFHIDYDSYDYDGFYMRPPGHLTPIKSDIAKQFKYLVIEDKSKDRGTDVKWAIEIVESGLIKTAAHIDEYMYFYDRVLYK